MDVKKAILVVFTVLIITIKGALVYAETWLHLTEEERDYIDKAGVIRAVSIDGVAPLHYKDSKGEIKGIAIRILEEIADMTGLTFEYELYNSSVETLESDADILFSLPVQYTPQGMMVSKTYLESEAILYINSSQDSDRLVDKTYAALTGGSLPEGVKEENAVYYGTREESLNAVETGEADYGYGNAYSVAFYTLQNGYKNIITVPRGKESREYRMGFPKNDRVLLSIINKSVDAIDENKIQTLILDVASQVDRKITPLMITDAYGKEIFSIVFVAVGVLLFSVISNARSNSELRVQNRINEMLSRISNEYLYKYFIKHDRLELSDKFIQLFKTREQLDEVSGILKDALLGNSLDGNIPMIKFPIPDGGARKFRSVGLNLYDRRKKSDLVVGKLIDISEETAEKRELIMRSKIDGLTGLYNAITVRELITERINSKNTNEMDAFLMMDCDKFKNVNDTYGHLTGDKVLQNVSKGLCLTFRQNDIIGRIGGDEFCVYMKNVPSIELVKSKCHQLNGAVQELNEDFYISVSIGIEILKEPDAYENLFKRADLALYEAKRRGGAQFVVYNKRVNVGI